MPLHEWTDEEDITTWVFEEGSFVPCAKLQNGESYSIITDYPGTPTEMYNSKGKKTWSAELDIYGCVRTFRGRSLSDCPFRAIRGSMRTRRQNSMTGIKQWQILERTTIIKGKVGAQLVEGSQYIGGANQIFVLEPWKYGTLF